MTKRREFSKQVRVEILQRAKVATGFMCEGCGVIVFSGEVDHTLADGLEIDKTRKLTAEDGKFLCHPCHAEKTKADVKAIAKAKRVESRHIGATPPPRCKLQSRGFQKRQRTPKPSLPPRPLYE